MAQASRTRAAAEAGGADLRSRFKTLDPVESQISKFSEKTWFRQFGPETAKKRLGPWEGL
jgi:hypothetical protein